MAAILLTLPRNDFIAEEQLHDSHRFSITYRLVVPRCERSRDESPGIAVRCAAMVPPAFIEYALRHGATKVRVLGCEPECAYRLGMELTDARFAGTREPHLRRTVRATRKDHEYSFVLH